MAAPTTDDMDGLSACECPVCFNFFSDTLPPMSMPCGHTLCSQCVNQLVTKATGSGVPTFRCPLCREWVNRNAVTLNHTLRDLIVQLATIGVSPGTPQTQQARVLSALHVDYHEIEMGPSLDRGAFGEVFMGYWRGNNVAVKMFSSGILTPEAMRAFQREVFVMNCLRHPNVVLLMGACQTPPKLAILMEYVGGGSLHKLIHVDKVALSLEQTCSLGGDVCRGLQYLHSINILHRDLKSKNVLLSAAPPTGHAKLCDFGLARMRLESATLTGNVGTVHWSAPEVLANTRYKFPADVYSLGMVLYEMSCGNVPFGSMVPLAVMMAVAVNKQKPAIPDSVDQQMAQLISQCISWEPTERPSVSTVLSCLHTITPPRTLTSTQERREQLSHSDSLGMVFVSVTDTSDLTDQANELVGVAHNMGIMTEQQMNRYPSEEDRQLAVELQIEERDAMLARDEELAHQLQLRENAYLTPSESKGKQLRPPKNVLDMIKSSTSKLTPTLPSKPKGTSKVVSPTSPPTSPNSLTSTTKSVTQSLKSALFSKATPKSRSKTVEDNAAPKPKASKSPVMKKKMAKVQSKPIRSKQAPTPQATPPHAPPPPPLPVTTPPSKKPTKPTLPPSQKVRVSKRELMKEVKSSGRAVAGRLRSVETVEKRAFRVGRVVDGYSSERAQYTFQNLIHHYNRKLLHHVSVEEPVRHFPVGRVLPPAKGTKVKRLSSLIEQQTTPTPVLHPAVRKEIVHFKPHALKTVTPVVHNTLPTVQDILSEKVDQEHTEQDHKDSVQSDQSASSHTLHPLIQSEIMGFNRKSLNLVTTDIKQWIPTAEDIALEKRLSARGESAESASSDKTNENVDGFW